MVLAALGSLTAQVKPVTLWIDAEANYPRLSTRDEITAMLDKAKSNGFNAIVLDVRPVKGEALYDSAFMPKCMTLGNKPFVHDWDYVRFFCDQAKERGMKVSLSATVFTMGLPEWRV